MILFHVNSIAVRWLHSLQSPAPTWRRSSYYIITDHIPQAALSIPVTGL